MNATGQLSVLGLEFTLEVRQGLCDGLFDVIGIGNVGLDVEGLFAHSFCNHCALIVWKDIKQSDKGALGNQSRADSFANTTGAAGDCA